MTNKEILTKAIQKAIDGGWDIETVGAFSDWQIDDNGLYDDRDYYVTERVTPFEIIFNHQFAKALWGEKQQLTSGLTCLHCSGDTQLSNPSGYCNHVHYPESCEVCQAKELDWKYHLQRMVVADDPIKYLGANI